MDKLLHIVLQKSSILVQCQYFTPYSTTKILILDQDYQSESIYCQIACIYFYRSVSSHQEETRRKNFLKGPRMYRYLLLAIYLQLSSPYSLLQRNLTNLTRRRISYTIIQYICKCVIVLVCW